MLYKHTWIAIKLGFSVSTFFYVGRGIRQGYPLSPFLFALAMETIAFTLRLSGEVGAIRVGMIN